MSAAIKHYKANGDMGAACVLTHYDSIGELEADCIARPMSREQNQEVFRRAVSSGESARYSSPMRWYGVDSLETVQRCIREGYPEGAAKVDALYDAIAPSLPRAIDFRRQRTRSDQGDSLDIHAVNRGALDKAWETVKRRASIGTGLIRIVADIGGNCNVSADALQWRGIAALALSRAMTKAGYSVEIVTAQAGSDTFTRKPNMHGLTTVTVKPRYAKVDTATLAASLCLPGFFRYAGFASIIRQADDLGYDVGYSLGHAAKVETLLPVPDKIAQVIVPETVNCRERAQAWVVEAVNMLQGSTISKENQR
jgi:hypothetical protein